MNKFDKALIHLLDIEGGYSNDFADRGGETYYGVSRRFHPETFDKIHAAKTDAERYGILAGFYYQTFWVPMRCESFHYPIAYELFEIAVNLGIAGATRVAQQAAQVYDTAISIDGVYGPRTFKALRDFAEARPVNMLGALNVMQGVAYRDIVA